MIMAVPQWRIAYFIIGLCHYASILSATHAPKFEVKYFENSEYPFILFVSEKNTDVFQDFLCTGALISKKHLIIPAQCIQDKQAKDLQVIGGSKEHLFSSSVAYDVASTITYKKWASSFPSKFRIFSQHDLAILQLKKKIRGITPAAVSVRNDSIKSGHEVNAIGWLEYRHPNAREFIRRPEEVPMVMLSSTKCAEESSSSQDLVNAFLLDETLCAETKSRGPLITARDQIGPVLDSDESLLGIVTEHYRLSSQKEVELILRLDDFTEFISTVTNNTVLYAY